MKVGIGIAVSAEPERLRSTLASIRANTQPDVIVVLASADADGANVMARPEFSTLQHFLLAEPHGGAACFNALAKGIEADVIILIESGAMVSPRWLDHLLSALAVHPRNGLAGPSTNRSWNAQAVFPRAKGTPGELARCAAEAWRRFGAAARTLEPLYSLGDFCYAVRREVVQEIGLADEGYGGGPCWEMDYNIRAARAGWRGVWAGAAYVYREPFTDRRRQEEARLFEANKRRYQDKFCGARLRGEKEDYRAHCRGDACPNFAPLPLLCESPVNRQEAGLPSPGKEAFHHRAPEGTDTPLVSCIMPTCDRLPFVSQAVRLFQLQDYPSLELIVVDDGAQRVDSVLPGDPRVRLIRLPQKQCIGAKRNVACAAARGEIIAHWDDDDWYPRDRVRLQVEALRKNGTVLCGTSVHFYHEPATGQIWRYQFAGGRAWVAGSTLAYRKSWWARHPFPEIQVGEDSRFVWAAPPEGVCDLRRPGLCVARVHDGNTSRKIPRGAFWEPCTDADFKKTLGEEWSVFFGENGAATVQPRRPVVSCIMPTRNRRAFLPMALETFQAQDYPDRELIVVEDGEEDVSDLVRELPKVRYLRAPPRSSIGHKRNLACQSAHGDIIAHWDDDDWYGVSRLSHQIAPLLEGRADMTGLENAYQLELAAGQFRRATAQLHRRMFVGDLHGGTLVYWKSLFTAGLRYPEVNLAEDAAFILQAQRRGKQILKLENPGLFVYVRHGRNSWHFPPSVTSDAGSWEDVSGPPCFSAQLMSAFRAASEISESSQ